MYFIVVKGIKGLLFVNKDFKLTQDNQHLHEVLSVVEQPHPLQITHL